MRVCVFLLLTTMIFRGTVRAEDSPVSISVAIPSGSGERRIEYGNPASHFNVVVANASEKPVRIWQERCSWGYDGLSFDVTDEAGKKWVVKQRPVAWDKNSPSWWDLAPHESLVIEVDFAKPGTWDGFPKPVNGTQKVTLRAALEFKTDEESRKAGVWTGRAEAKPLDVIFSNWKPSSEKATGDKTAMERKIAAGRSSVADYIKKTVKTSMAWL